MADTTLDDGLQNCMRTLADIEMSIMGHTDNYDWEDEDGTKNFGADYCEWLNLTDDDDATLAFQDCRLKV